MMRRLVTVLVLTAFWIALWEDLSWANLVGGMAVSVFAVYLVPPSPSTQYLTVRPLALIHLAGYFLVKLVEASAIVAWEVVTPRNRIQEAVVAVPLRSGDPFMITTLANAVSLTPGTITLEARREPPTLYIHVLHFKSVDAIRSDVRRLEELAHRALVAVPIPEAEPGPETDSTITPKGNTS